MTPTFEQLTGRAEDHVIAWKGSVRIHRSAHAPFSRLVERARKAGFEIEVASGFRDFEGQRRIWDRKARGERVLLDRTGKPLDFASLKPDALVHAILRWSALPGSSRHHWGTELDVFPANLLAKGQTVQLVPDEIAPGGIFESFGHWLESEHAVEGFFRPYRVDLGGVSPEWWHLSYAPVATPYFAAYDLEVFIRSLEKAEFELKAEVLKQAEALYHRYFATISPPTDDSPNP